MFQLKHRVHQWIKLNWEFILTKDNLTKFEFEFEEFQKMVKNKDDPYYLKIMTSAILIN